MPARILILVALGLPAVPLRLSTESVQDRVREFRLVEDMRINGEREDLFAIGFVLPTPLNGVVISEPRDFRLRFYDERGKEIGRIGRRGGGPGEFAGQGPRAWLKAGITGDSVWVYDFYAGDFRISRKPKPMSRPI